MQGGGSTRTGLDKGKGNESGLGRDMETDRRKGNEAGLSIGVTPGARNLNSKKRYVPSRGDKDAETEI